MERKAFIKTCGFACLSGTLFAAVADGCSSSKMIAATLDSRGLYVPLSVFQQAKSFKKYVVVQNEQLKYPVCIYRFSDTDYSALLMRCTHQGAELQVFGDRLECPAHNSQFNNKGKVQNGPADTNLRTFAVTIQNDQLHIALT